MRRDKGGKAARQGESADSNEKLIGRNPVLEALRAGRPIRKLLLAGGDTQGSIQQIRGLARDRGILIQELDRSRLDAMVPGQRHQGVIALVAAREYVTVDEILGAAARRGEDALILVLDGIADPQNLGSLVRSGEAAGVHGIIIPARRAAGITPAVAKVAAGALEYMPVAEVTNIADTLDTLKAAGLWVCGLESRATQSYYEAKLTGPLAVVVGSEGKGLRRLVALGCDFLVSLPMRGRMSSLNAAVAGAIMLYEVQRQRWIASGDKSEQR